MLNFSFNELQFFGVNDAPRDWFHAYLSGKAYVAESSISNRVPIKLYTK